VAGLLLTVVALTRTTSDGGVTVAELGGISGLLAAGAFLGLVYAWLFQPVPGGHAENLMTGIALGVITWVVLAMNVFPTLTGNGPMWE
ncbi:MAG: hypothetical protein ACE10G_02575, partial [Gemmatimonadales bacterium]